MLCGKHWGEPEETYLKQKITTIKLRHGHMYSPLEMALTFAYHLLFYATHAHKKINNKILNTKK